MFFLVDALQRVDNILQAMCQLEIQLFRIRIAVNPIFFFSLHKNKKLSCVRLKTTLIYGKS